MAAVARRWMLAGVLAWAHAGCEGGSSGPSTTGATDAAQTSTSGMSDSTAAASTLTTSSTPETESSTTPGSTETGSTASSASEDDTAGTDTGPGALVPCGPEEPPCPGGTFCQRSGCCFEEGVCVTEGTPTCEDTGLDACEPGLRCLQDACINEQPGVCLPNEVVDEICMLQTVGCWTTCPVP